MNRLKHNFGWHILSFTMIVLLLAACDNRPKGVLSQSEMVDILTDMHKLEGTLDIKGMEYADQTVKMGYYNSIMEKYGTTKAEFDSSLVWYSKNPIKFEKIYNKVVVQVTHFQEDISKGKYHNLNSVEESYKSLGLWDKQTKYAFTGDSTRTRLDFEIPGQNFMLGDIYELKFIQRIAPNDSCESPTIRFLINYSNGRSVGVIRKAYHDGVTRRFTFRLPATVPSKIKSISGQLLGSKRYKGTFTATIDSISLTQLYNPAKQDSLLKVLQKEDPKNYPVYTQVEDSTAAQRIRQNIRSLVLRKRCAQPAN